MRSKSGHNLIIKCTYFCVFITIVGCDGSGAGVKESRLSQYGGVKYGQVNPPEVFKIVNPSEGAEYKPGETIECIVLVRVSTRSQVPSVLHVEFWDRDNRTSLGGFYPEPLGEPADGEYRFKATREAPAAPGRYRIRAEGVDYVARGDGPGVVFTEETAADDAYYLVK